MRRLGAPPDADGLSQLLLRLTVSSTVYCRSEMSSPWGFEVGAQRNAAFHLLTAGGGWLDVHGIDEAIRLEAGDLVLLPRGPAHTVRDSRTSPTRWLERILADTPPVDGRLSHGGGGAVTELVCGGFAIDQLTARPLLETLPAVVHLRGHEGRAPEWLSGLIRMVAVEMASSRPGTEAVVTRLTDALLAQALRQCLLELDASAPGAMTDPQVARALRLIRERPAHPWTVPEIASAVGLSRSAFADRFRAATGETPMGSLTRSRLARAAEYLRTTNAGVGEIARLVGYDSDVSISKAFRREFGTSPGAYRRANAPVPPPVMTSTPPM